MTLTRNLGDPVLSTWPDRLATWLRDRGFLAVATARIRNGDFKLDEKLGPVAAPVRVTVTYSAADTPGVPGTNGVVTTTKPRPDAEPWRLDFSGAIDPEPLTIEIVR